MIQKFFPHTIIVIYSYYNFFKENYIPAHWPSGFNPRSSYTKDLKKMVFDTSLLRLSDIRYVSKVKGNNLGKGVAPSPTPWCSSYRKGSLLVTLDYGYQLYLPTLHTLWSVLDEGDEYSKDNGFVLDKGEKNLKSSAIIVLLSLEK